MEQWQHYLLIDPRIDDPIKCVRYVGREGAVGSRFPQHLTAVKRGSEFRLYNTHLYRGIRKMLREGVTPVCVPIGPGDDTWEIALIREFRAAGARLWNSTDGGEGFINPTPETRERRRAALTEVMGRPEYRARMSSASKEMHARSEFKERHAAAIKEALSSPETKQRLSAAAKANHARPEVKAKQVASLKEVMSRPEVVEKLSVNAKRSWQNSDVRQRRSAGIKEAASRPGERERRSAAMKAYCAQPEAKQRRSALSKERMADPNERAKMSVATRLARNKPVDPLAFLADLELQLRRDMRDVTHKLALIWGG